MTFAQFLKKFRKEESAIGDFARDWASDKKQPKKVDSIKVINEHLEKCGACYGAYTVARKAWRLFKNATAK